MFASIVINVDVRASGLLIHENIHQDSIERFFGVIILVENLKVLCFSKGA